jgi:hypothetical protein
MIATLITSAGNKNGIDEDDDFTTETQSSQRDIHHKDTKDTKAMIQKILTQRRKGGGLIAAKRHKKRKKKAGVTVETLKARKRVL